MLILLFQGRTNFYHFHHHTSSLTLNPLPKLSFLSIISHAWIYHGFTVEKHHSIMNSKHVILLSFLKKKHKSWPLLPLILDCQTKGCFQSAVLYFLIRFWSSKENGNSYLLEILLKYLWLMISCLGFSSKQY